MLQKRNDIQWLRGFAIIAVLAFHLLPESFPCGYLGVDVFFVISGYLMTCILSKQSGNFSWKSMLYKFYSRRICRIFPSYFIVLGLTFIVGKWLLLSFHFTFLSKEMLWASFFATNLKSLFEKESYFQLTSEYRFLLHTWSLGVEIQFYFYAPFILTVIGSSKTPCLFSSMAIILSAGSQLYYYNSPISFDFFGCRLWQFLCGTIMYYATTSTSSMEYTLLAPSGEKQTTKIYSFCYAVLLILLSLLCFGPKYSMLSEFYESIFRFLATVLAALLIYLGSTFQPNIPHWCSEILTYLGDISYAVYLYHWPILLFAKYYGFDTSKFLTLMGLLLLIFTVSIIHYHLIETKLSKLSPAVNYWIIASLFCTILYFSLSNYQLTSTSTKIVIDEASLAPLNDSEAIRINLEMAANCDRIPIKCAKDALLNGSFNVKRNDDNFEGRCVLNLSKTGTKTAIVLGNSFAMRHIDAIVAALNTSEHSNTFSKIYLVTWKGCPTFESTHFEVADQFNCPQVKGLMVPFLQKLRPSLTVLLNRLEHLPTFSKTPLNLTDKKFISFQNDFLTIANLSSQTIVIEPHHIIGDTISSAVKIAKRISDKLPLMGLERNATEVRKELDLSWTKMKAAVSSCKNCHILETLKYFCNETICEAFDRKNRLSYFCDSYHFTPVATKKIIEPLKALINTLIF